MNNHHIYAWLGMYRDDIPEGAVEDLQRILGPLQYAEESNHEIERCQMCTLFLDRVVELERAIHTFKSRTLPPGQHTCKFCKGSHYDINCPAAPAHKVFPGDDLIPQPSVTP